MKPDDETRATHDGVGAKSLPRTEGLPGDDLDKIEERWLCALHETTPNLANPIAIAMVRGAARGSIGIALGSIESGLVQIEETDLSRLTGSEVKVLTAILIHMKQRVGQLEMEITRLYVAQDK